MELRGHAAREELVFVRLRLSTTTMAMVVSTTVLEELCF